MPEGQQKIAMTILYMIEIVSTKKIHNFWLIRKSDNPKIANKIEWLENIVKTFFK